ncbi:radical SAM protein [Desulfopila sp. IMCC35008]|uniref:radical SAM protein n=1 Tax=Desulfopila sp. IMCC35008 TaxID=2653858 RepID=UPI0013D62BD7|nr:radical SAM protein [Desulfopila sp. IMCC35008]
MARDDVKLRIIYKYSGEENEVLLSSLTDTVISFLDQMATRQLTGPTFFQIIRKGTGSDKFSRLLSACQHDDNPEGFFRELLDKLGVANGSDTITINGVEMPHLLLVAILEIVLPGNGFISIKTVDALEKAANLNVPEEDRGAMQEVIDTYPVRLSMHTIRQMRVSRDVAYQYLPFTEELEKVGHTNTWIGQFHQGLLEQMYQNRVIFLLNMSCPVYCRFCFRKHKESRNEANPTPEDVKAAVEHVRNSPSIKEVVVTGGDPFMSKNNMAATIDNLMAVEHVQTLRLATRSVAYYPDLFLAEDGRLLTYLKRKHLELQERGKRIELATHFIHPDEISPQCLMIITDLVKNGIGVYIQTPFLDGCNDKGPELVRLFNLLRGAGAELHYIYIPCSPIHGNSVYWSPISKGHEAGNYLRAHLSDRIVPRICTATPIGKMDWNSSGWAVEPVRENENFIWIRSPYTPEYFKEFAPLANELQNIRVNAEGTIDIQYMAKIGDESLFYGPRPPRTEREKPEAIGTEAVAGFIAENEGISPSLVETGSPLLSRVHETRVEIDTDISDAELDYISKDERITDVVVFSKTDIVNNLHKIVALVKKLDDIPHVNSLRLRSLAFNTTPHHYTPLVIDLLAGLNKLTMVNPLRLEIEAQFLKADDITDEHTRLTRILKNKGITVYSNTPLLGRINDSAEEIHRLAYRCREAGIEFHHLFVTGTPVQQQWNIENPIYLYDVVDIATKVRREGSGREIPRYIIKTELGEVDFGLTSTITGEGSKLQVKLDPYDMSYYRSLSSDFTLPESVTIAEDGHPVVTITGLLKTTEHPLS